MQTARTDSSGVVAAAPGQAGSSAGLRPLIRGALWRPSCGWGVPGWHWRDLPAHLGQWHRVYKYGLPGGGTRARGSPTSLADKLKTAGCRIRVSGTVASLGDRRAGAQHGTGAAKKTANKSGNTPRCTWSGRGQVLGWQLTAGQAGDAPQAAGLLARFGSGPTGARRRGQQRRVAGAHRRRRGQRRHPTRIPGRKNPPLFDPVRPTKTVTTSSRRSASSSNSGALPTRYDRTGPSFDAFICLRVSPFSLIENSTLGYDPAPYFTFSMNAKPQKKALPIGRAFFSKAHFPSNPTNP